MNQTKRNRASKFLAITCIGALLITSFAFFTDKAEINGTAKAGTLAVGIEVGDDISTQLIGTDGINNWNPGDSQTFTYTVENDGNKAIRAQETLTLTVLGGEGEREITAADVKLTLKDDTGNDLAAVNAVSATAVEGGYELKYILPEFVLSGKDGVDNTEVIEDKEDTNTVTYTLDFDETALNNYQAADIEIVVHVDAIQYYNTTGDGGVAQNEVYNASIQLETVISDETGITA